MSAFSGTTKFHFPHSYGISGTRSFSDFAVYFASFEVSIFSIFLNNAISANAFLYTTHECALVDFNNNNISILSHVHLNLCHNKGDDKIMMSMFISIFPNVNVSLMHKVKSICRYNGMVKLCDFVFYCPYSISTRISYSFFCSHTTV